MAEDQGEVASLRHALADAERIRDEALAQASLLQQRWDDERREEQHRLRNMLSVIRTIARRTSHEVDTVEEYSGLLDGRLQSYLRVQAALAQDWHRGWDLGLLLADELLAFDVREGEGVELDGPPINVTSRAAGLLALAFHELVATGILAGRLDQKGSGLHVKWRLSGAELERRLLIEWTEIVFEADGGDNIPSSWADWVDQAVAHQLAGTMSTELTDTKRIARLDLPASALAKESLR